MSRRERWVVGAIFLVGALLRLAHLLTAQHAPFFSLLYIDPLMYDEWGTRIASGQLMSERPFFLDPLYSYFLGLVFAVFGHSYFAVVAVQCLLGATIPALVYFPTRRWFDPPTATVAAAIAAVYLPGIYFCALIMKPCLASFLVALCLWLFSRGLDSPRRWPLWWVAGIVLGCACLVRGNLLLVAPVLVAWILVRDGWRSIERPRWIESGSLAVGLALVLSLPAIHNYIVGGEFILTTANAGANFYIGNNPDNRTGEYMQLPFIRANPKYEQHDFKQEAERRARRTGMTDREVSAFWFAETGKGLSGRPGLWIRLMWTKLRAFWGAYEIADSLDYYLYREYAPVLRIPLPGFGLLAPLALLGGILALRRPGWPRLLLLLIGVYCLTVVVFFVFSRFRMIVAPALYVLAAHGALELVRRIRDCARSGAPARRPAVVAGLTFVLLFVFVNLPVRARPESWGYRLASTLSLPTQPERSVQGHFNLGVAYAQFAKDQNAEAQAHWLEESQRELALAVELHGDATDTAKIHVELGKVLARQKKHREAIEVYRAAEKIEPGDFQIHHALGILYRRDGDLVRSAESFQHALRLAPGHLQSATRLGDVLLELQRPAEAALAFEHALRINPRNAEALRGLDATRRTAN